jgi:hypothetical protein
VGACLTAKEVPFASRAGNVVEDMLPWPAFGIGGEPRSPRGPTSGTPAQPYRECWGRRRTRQEPGAVIDWSIVPGTVPPVPDYTICRNNVAVNANGPNCNASPNGVGIAEFGFDPRNGHPFYFPTDDYSTWSGPLCNIFCACCPCETFCVSLLDFSAPLFIGGVLDGPMNFRGTGPGVTIDDTSREYLCIDNSTPQWFVIDGQGGYGWVRELGGDDLCHPDYSAQGALQGPIPYTLVLSSMVVWSAPVFGFDCFVTVLFTWSGFFLGTSTGDTCDFACNGGVLVNNGDPDCVANPNRSFGVTGIVSFSINACPNPDDPNPQSADISDMILQPSNFAWAFGDGEVPDTSDSVPNDVLLRCPGALPP